MSPVVLLVCAHSSPVLLIEYAGIAISGVLSGWTVATWLAIRSWSCILLALVLYMCTGGMLHIFPLYGCVSGDRASVSSRMTWGLV